jgi:hypothetical protein
VPVLLWELRLHPRPAQADKTLTRAWATQHWLAPAPRHTITTRNAQRSRPRPPRAFRVTIQRSSRRSTSIDRGAGSQSHHSHRLTSSEYGWPFTRLDQRLPRCQTADLPRSTVPQKEKRSGHLSSDTQHRKISLVLSLTSPRRAGTNGESPLQRSVGKCKQQRLRPAVLFPTGCFPGGSHGKSSPMVIRAADRRSAEY